MTEQPHPHHAGVLFRAVLPHPSLWRTALRQAHYLAPTGWWRRPPFLPVPHPDYLQFRMVTAYGGDGTAPPTAHDVVTYLQWCKAWPEAARTT